MRNRLWRQEQKAVHKKRRYVRQGFDAYAEKDVMKVDRGYHHHCKVDHNGDCRPCTFCDPINRDYEARWMNRQDLAWWIAQA